MAKQFLWITNTEENIQFYRDSSPKSNLSLHFASAIDCDTKKNICRFVRYLRKEFFFPIRCNVYFCNQEKFHSSKGGYCYGIFYSNEESGGRIYPQVYIPTSMDLFSVYHSLSHELTHYFQWYFLDDNEKATVRSKFRRQDMRIAFWKIIVVTIVKSQTVHVMVAADNKFCIKITVICQQKGHLRVSFLLLFVWKIRTRSAEYRIIYTKINNLRNKIDNHSNILYNNNQNITVKRLIMKTVAYFNGAFGDFDTMTVPMSERSIYFGDAVYDAVLVLDGKAFTLDMHLDRLYNSCSLMNIDFTMERAELNAEINKLLSLGCGGIEMLYVQVSRGNASRKHEFPENVRPNLLMFVKSITLPSADKRASLLSMEDMRFKYCNIKTVNLLPNVFAAQKATESGYTEAIMHRDGRVTEAAHSSILILKNGKVIMPPLDNLILPGITRAVISQICEELGIPAEIREFTLDEVMDADEILLCSTTKNVIFVYNIDGREVGGKDQETAKKIQELFLDKIYKETGVRL